MDSLSLFEYLILLISIVFIVKSSLAYVRKQRRQTIYKVLLTYVIWGGVMVLILFPKISYDIASLLGVQNNVSALVFLGFVVVFFVIFRLLDIVSKLESTMTDLVREIAIRNGISDK